MPTFIYKYLYFYFLHYQWFVKKKKINALRKEKEEGELKMHIYK